MTFTFEINNCNTRGANNIMIPKIKKEKSKKSFQVNGGLLWNAIPSDIRMANNVNDFKRRYKKAFFM